MPDSIPGSYVTNLVALARLFSSLLLGLGLRARLLLTITLVLTLTVTSIRLSSTVAISGGTTSGRSTLGDGHVGRSAAEVALSGEDLVVMGTKLHAVLLPSLEVSTNIDAASGSVVLANGPVLLKGLGTVDRRSVGTGTGEDFVGAAIDLDSSLALSSARGIVGAEILDDVVLDQGVSGPSIDGKVAVAVRLVLSLVRDGSGDVSVSL